MGLSGRYSRSSEKIVPARTQIHSATLERAIRNELENMVIDAIAGG
jgi:hypothetical protein